MRKARPCVVVQRITDDATPVVIVCPITDARGRAGNLLNPSIPSGVGGMLKESRVAVHQIRAVDKRRATGPLLGQLPAAIMADVSRGLRAILDL